MAGKNDTNGQNSGVPAVAPGKSTSPAVPAHYTIERIRRELVEKRRKDCGNIIKERKRRLCELYTVFLMPFAPISSERVLQNEKDLAGFLERNDLAKGREFNIAALAHRGEPARKRRHLEKERGEKTLEKPRVETAESGKEKEDRTKSKDVSRTQEILPGDGQEKDAHAVREPSPKKSKVEAIPQSSTSNTRTSIPPESTGSSISGVSHSEKVEKHRKDAAAKVAQLAAMPILTRHHVENRPGEPETLSSMIAQYAQNPIPGRADAKGPRDMDWRDMDLQRQIMALMPEGKPHRVAAARSLIELYYQERTLQLPRLLLRAHKAVTSRSFEASLVEGKVAVLFSRIEELKRQQRWSLRQPRKYMDPFISQGQHTVWDGVLEEGRWVAEDMRQLRRFKAASGCTFAEEALEIRGKLKKVDMKDERDRKSKEDKEIEETQPGKEADTNTGKPEKAMENADTTEVEAVKAASKEVKNDDTEMKDSANENQKGKEVNEVKKAVDNGDKTIEDASDSKGLKSDKAKESMEKVASIRPSDTLLDHTLISSDDSAKATSTNAAWMTGGLPLTVYHDDLSPCGQGIVDHIPQYKPLGGRAAAHAIERDPFGHVSVLLPPKDDMPSWYKVVAREMSPGGLQLSSGSSASSAGRSASGANRTTAAHPLFGPYRRFNVLKPLRPPPLRNIQLRIPTIWLPSDDRKLIRYVTQFSFNWEIIAACLAPKPTLCRYFSNIERRTPWQCFERYIQLNNRFRFSDMRGRYTAAAREWLQTAHRVQVTTRRRISPLGVGQESVQRGHRRLRWASMFEAMRKLMRRREAANVGTSSGATSTTSADGGKDGGEASSNVTADSKTSESAQVAQAARFDTPTPEQLSHLKWERDRAIRRAYVAAAGTGSPHSSQNAGMGQPLGMRTPQGATAAQFRRLMQIQQRQRQRQAQHEEARRRRAEELAHARRRAMGERQASSTPTPEQVLAAAQQPSHTTVNAVGSPMRQQQQPLHHFSTAQVSAVARRIEARNPSLTREQIVRLAVSYLARYEAKVMSRRRAHAAQAAQAQAVNAATGTGSILEGESALAAAQQMRQRQLQLLMQRQAMNEANQGTPHTGNIGARPASSPVSAPARGGGYGFPRSGTSVHTSPTLPSQAVHTHHTPTPEEIQLAMNQHVQQVGKSQGRSTQARPLQGGRAAQEGMTLEEIEEDILNTDFSLLDGAN